MITLHHLEKSRSHRVLWLLEELGLQYELKEYRRDPKTSLAPPELQQVHPLGKAPVITDGDVTMAESAAILEYVIERYAEGRLIPPAGTDARWRYLYWMHYAEGSLMPYLLLKLVFRRVEEARLPFFVKPIAKGISKKVHENFLGPNLERHTQFLEQELAGREWLAGDDLTGADIQMSYPVEALASRQGMDGLPNIAAYLERLRSRPAYQRALEKGGPVMLDG